MNSQLVIESISLECDPFSQLCPEHESEKNIVQLELPQIGEMIPQVSQTGSLEDGRNGLAPRDVRTGATTGQFWERLGSPLDPGGYLESVSATTFCFPGICSTS
jgi:hypothetical protein